MFPNILYLRKVDKTILYFTINVLIDFEPISYLPLESNIYEMSSFHFLRRIELA